MQNTRNNENTIFLRCCKHCKKQQNVFGFECSLILLLGEILICSVAWSDSHGAQEVIYPHNEMMIFDDFEEIKKIMSQQRKNKIS